MKAKKTLRKLSPLARELARFQRELHSLERRMDRLIDSAGDIERDARIAQRAEREVRERLAALDSPDLFPRILEIPRYLGPPIGDEESN